MGAFLVVLGATHSRPVHADPLERELDPTQLAKWRLPNPDLYAVAAHGARVWAAGYWGTVLVSRDGGESFHYADTPAHSTLFDVSFADELHGWAVGELGTVIATQDGGETWRVQPVEIEDELGDRVPLDTSLFGVEAISRTEVWAVGDLGVVLRSRDGVRWERVALPESVFADENLTERILNAVQFSDARRGWIVGEFGTVLRTEDGGDTWLGTRDFEHTTDEPYLFDVGVSAAVKPSDADAARPRTAWNGRSSESGPLDVPASLDSATERDGVANGARRNGSGVSAAAPGSAPSARPAAAAPLTAAVSLAGTVLVSRDGGQHWAAHDIPDDAALYAAATHERSIVVAGNRGAIYWSADAGRTWRAAERPRLFGWLAGAVYADAQRVFVVGSQGALLRSRDGGRSFVAVDVSSVRPAKSARSRVEGAGGVRSSAREEQIQ